MKRRGLIVFIGTAAIAWPLAARAQQKAMPEIGWLGVTTPEPGAKILVGIRAGLAETGFVEGQNLAIEYRWSEGHNDRLPALAAELVARPVDVIITGSVPGTRAAMKATSTIPIVTMVGVDPVATGLVKDLAHPDGNLTGFTGFGPRMNIKRFEILSQLVPEARVMVYLINPNNPATFQSIEQFGRLSDEFAKAKGIALHRVSAGNPAQIDEAFSKLGELRAEGLMPGIDPLFDQYKDQIVALAARYRIPTIYYNRRFTDAGGLISYGVKAGEQLPQVGAYAGRILAGAKVADLPFQMPAKFELVINRKAATALGLTIPVELETLADEIIE
jgi:putative ABC transport system substrate-binding protein